MFVCLELYLKSHPAVDEGIVLTTSISANEGMKKNQNASFWNSQLNNASLDNKIKACVKLKYLLWTEPNCPFTCLTALLFPIW